MGLIGLIFETATIILAILLVFMAGYYVGNDYSFSGIIPRNFDGLYFPNWTYDDVEDYTSSVDPRGDWVCINVYKMDYERALEVCQHECGHAAFDEIYAEECEYNFTRCKEIFLKE